MRVEIIRIPWFRGIFFKLLKNPLFEFIYLFPGLFFVLPLVLLIKPNINVIHSHGLVSGAVSVFWGKIFGKKIITTTHSIYGFKNNAFSRFSKIVFNLSDHVLTLSKQSKMELIKLGVNEYKITVFTYWVDLGNFKRIKNARKILNIKAKFIVLFVGRLVEEKGIKILLNAANKWNKNITLIVVGSGPLEEEVKKLIKANSNMMFAGKISQADLPLYYSVADVLIVPSIHEEGFGRVIIESLACGTPVIGSNRGAIPEAITSEVGILIEVSSENIYNIIEDIYLNPDRIRKLSLNCTEFASRVYSSNNIDKIISAYN